MIPNVLHLPLYTAHRSGLSSVSVSVEIDEHTIARFARCELPIDEWDKVYWRVRGDDRVRQRIAEIIASVDNEAERQRLTELHGVLCDYEERMARAIHGDRDPGGQSAERPGG